MNTCCCCEQGKSSLECLGSYFLVFPYFSEGQTGTQIGTVTCPCHHWGITCLRTVAWRRGVPRPRALWAPQKFRGLLGAWDVARPLSQTTERGVVVRGACGWPWARAVRVQHPPRAVLLHHQHVLLSREPAGKPVPSVLAHGLSGRLRCSER